MSSSCDLGQYLNEVKLEFPEFDFSLLKNFTVPEFWFLEVLENEALKKEFLDKIAEAFPNQQDAFKNASKFLANEMKKSYPKESEDQISLNTRVAKAKAWLREKAQELGDGEFLAVVAHSRFLQSFVSKEYGALGELIGSRRFVNCEVFEYEI